MKKFLSVACATIASLILVYVIVFTSLQIVINDQRFISNEYTELELNKAMGVSNSDLVRSFNQLSLYMQGRVDTIHLNVKINGVEQDMFSYEQEETHNNSKPQRTVSTGEAMKYLLARVQSGSIPNERKALLRAMIRKLEKSNKN